MTETRPAFETASICPRCDTPGEDRKEEREPKGSTLHYIYCVNDRCKWFDTFWIVTVNADGTVPAPKDHTGEKKIYKGFEGHDRRAAELIDTLKRNAEAELRPGGAEL